MRKLSLLLVLVMTVFIAGETITIEKFTGELSPFVDARYDLSEYQGGLRELTNMVVEPQGGVTKRPGTYYIGGVVGEVPGTPAIPPAQIRDEALVIANNTYVQFFDPNYETLSQVAVGGGAIMSVDVDGNGVVVAGRPGSTTDVIWRWDADMNLDKNFYTPDAGYWGWGIGSSYIPAVRFTDDSEYLYVVYHNEAVTPYTFVYKFDNTTGAEEWNTYHRWETFGAAVDEDDNIWVPFHGTSGQPWSGEEGYGVVKYDSDGNRTVYSFVTVSGRRDCWVDDDIGRVFWSGSRVCSMLKDGTEFWSWNNSDQITCIRTFENRLYICGSRQSTIAGPWSDADGDPNCVALWNFESGALTTDSRGNQTLTASGSPAADTVNYKEGAASVDLESDDSDRYTFAPYEPSFPLCVGDADKKISIAFWCKMEELPPNGVGHTVFSLGTSGARVFYITAVGTGTGADLYLAIGYDDGDEWEYVNGYDTEMEATKWYHCLVTYNGTDKSYTMRIWDDDAGALLSAAESGNSTNDINIEETNRNIGYLSGVGTSYWDGNIDCLAVFNDIVTANEQDEMIAGTFTYGTSNAGNCNIWELDPDNGEIINGYDTGSSAVDYLWPDADGNIVAKDAGNEKFYVFDSDLTLQDSYDWEDKGDVYGGEGIAIDYMDDGTPGTPADVGEDLSGEPVRIIDYTYRTEKSYIVECGQHYMVFYKEAD